MSSNLMETEIGGEQTQYEGAAPDVKPHKKSGGQLGSAETTTDVSETRTHSQQHAEAGERKAENMRYGQAISEQGVGGMTENQTGFANQDSTKQSSNTATTDVGGASTRVAGGYDGSKDMDNNVGA